LVAFVKQACQPSAVEAPIKNMNTGRVALIAGSTGIVGGSLALLLMEQGWKVYGLVRRPSSLGGIVPVIADLLDLSGLIGAP
jgi:nucleoside-diphosphate-sugar epimerase